VELGNLYIKKGNRDKAITEFEKALLLEPQASQLKTYIEKLKSN
jgi:tetratricopeptide (TPR) repeat protein